MGESMSKGLLSLALSIFNVSVFIQLWGPMAPLREEIQTKERGGRVRYKSGSAAGGSDN